MPLLVFVILIFSFSSFSQVQLHKISSPYQAVYLFYTNLLKANTQNAELKTAKDYFTNELFTEYQQLINRNQIPDCIDYDLLIGGQDTPESFAVASQNFSDKKKAHVRVKLFYNKQPVVRILSLIKTADGWKINNIQYVENHNSMRSELLRCKAKAHS